MERVMLTRLQVIELWKKISLQESYIGLREGLCCDINLMRLRQRCNDLVNERRNTNEKYVFFIDLKEAYDSVRHDYLFTKISNNFYPHELINCLKKNSGAKMRLNLQHNPININKGALQSGILSPFLFNWYINHLIVELKTNCYEVLA